MAHTADLVRLDQWIAARLPGWLDEVAEFCAIPSEEGEPAALESAARWIADRLRAAGAVVETHRVDGAPPLVVGELGEGPRTLIAVQHYDVQPAGDPSAWTTPPYDPAIRDGRLYARGAIDNKGTLLGRIWGLEAQRATIGPIPTRVRFLVEGEEESLSPNLGRLLDLRPTLREGDGALIEGGATDTTGRPLIIGGMRGMVLLDLTARTLAYDAHSSQAMLLPNAAVRMAQAVAALFDAEGRPAIPGLDATVAPRTAEQLAFVRANLADDLPGVRAEYGIDRFVGGLDGLDALLAATFAPTANVQGLWSGHTVPGNNNITPAVAHARLDLRLVPDQDPDAVVAAVRAALVARGFADIEVTPGRAAKRPYWTPPTAPILDLAARVSEDVFGRPSLRRLSDTGSGPMFDVCAAHRVPCTSLGGGHEDCRAHAPDENVRLDHLEASARCMARFVAGFAAL